MNTVTEITRRNIFDSLSIENIIWSGRLSEEDFLARLFDLSKLPSYDSRFKDATGDIWQHRVNNHDWNDDWVFYDDRFNLLKCDDTVFLQFLCEMLHPIVRADLTEVNKLKQMFNEHLAQDGWEVVEKIQVSGKPVFAGRKKMGNIPITKRKEEIKKILTEEYVLQQITLMESSIDIAPHIAIGIAKELIETVCKTILNERAISFEKNWDLPRLLKETNQILKLTPKDIPNEAKAVTSIRSILGSLSVVVQGICELRNDYGNGHGKESDFKGLSSRHAKLAVGAASTLAIFLLETNKIRI